MSIITKSIYKFHIIPLKILSRYFVDIGKLIPRCIWKGADPRIANTTLIKKAKGGIHSASQRRLPHSLSDGRVSRTDRNKKGADTRGNGIRWRTQKETSQAGSDNFWQTQKRFDEGRTGFRPTALNQLDIHRQKQQQQKLILALT